MESISNLFGNLRRGLVSMLPSAYSTPRQEREESRSQEEVNPTPPSPPSTGGSQSGSEAGDPDSGPMSGGPPTGNSLLDGPLSERRVRWESQYSDGERAHTVLDNDGRTVLDSSLGQKRGRKSRPRDRGIFSGSDGSYWTPPTGSEMFSGDTSAVRTDSGEEFYSPSRSPYGQRPQSPYPTGQEESYREMPSSRREDDQTPSRRYLSGYSPRPFDESPPRSGTSWSAGDVETSFMSPGPRPAQVSTPYPQVAKLPMRETDHQPVFGHPRFSGSRLPGQSTGRRDVPYSPFQGPQTGAAASGEQPAHIDPRTSRREKQPDLFDDTVWEWEDYLSHFLSVAMWNGWSEREKAQQLVMSLRGKAQTVLGGLTRQELGCFEALKTLLTRRYCPTQRRSSYRNDFRYRKRHRDESPSTFASALRRLAGKAHPQLSEGDRDALCEDQFIFGLIGPDVTKHVQFGHPEDLDAAVDLAVELESLEGVRGIRKPAGFVSPVVSRNMPTLEAAPVQQTGQVELVQAVKENTEVLKRLLAGQALSNQGQQNVAQAVANQYNQDIHKQGQAYGSRRRLRDTGCFICSDKTHFARQCPWNPRHQPGQALSEQGESTEVTGNEALNREGLRLRPEAQAN